MQDHKVEIAETFKYLSFTWTSKLSLRPTVDQSLEKTEKALAKLRWLNKGGKVLVQALKQRLFVYVFPHLAWLFPVYPFLPKTQREALDRKFRVGIRIVHRCPYVKAEDLFTVTKQKRFKIYVQKYIKKRLENLYKSDLSRSPFFEDIFYRDRFRKRKNDSLGQFFRMNRVKKLLNRHETLLIEWINFIQQ